MKRQATHPKAQHPLDGVTKAPACSYPASDRSFLNAVMLEATLHRCAPYVRGRVLDVGCGKRPYEGTFFSGATRYVATDYLTDRSRPEVVSAAMQLPFQNESFDTVVSTEVLEHVPAPARALSEMRRVLRSDGVLILTAPYCWPRHEAPFDFFRYPYDGLVALLQTADFEVIQLFNRGRSYAFLGQAIQHVQPFSWKPLCWAINRFFLWCDRRFDHDVMTIGWTVIARCSRTQSEHNPAQEARQW